MNARQRRKAWRKRNRMLQAAIAKVEAHIAAHEAHEPGPSDHATHLAAHCAEFL